MKQHAPFAIAVRALAVAIGVTSPIAIGQQPVAPATKGTRVLSTTAVDLGPEIEGLQGRQLRVRVMVMEPGGEIAAHNHKDRPGAVYVVKGTLTETRGDQVKNYHAGDTWLENKETTHSVRNNGTEPTTAVVVDIFRTQ